MTPTVGTDDNQFPLISLSGCVHRGSRFDRRRGTGPGGVVHIPQNRQAFLELAPNLGMDWSRRTVLRSSAAVGVLGVAGCLERLGFEEQSAWETPDMVEDRPDAVYMPPASEEMGIYGQDSTDDYVLEVSYTFPHRFWLVAGDRERVDVQPDDTLHLMMVVWDAETGTVLPVDMSLEITDADGDLVHGDAPWSMLSQRMGFHYGDNVDLPGEGTYTASARVGPVSARRTGDLEGRLDEAVTLEVDFEYQRSDLHDLELNMLDDDEQGEPGALPLMDHSDHDHGHDDGGDHDGHDHHDDLEGHGHGEHDHPTVSGPPVADLEGTLLGTETTADAALSALVSDQDRFEEDAPALAIFPRTPYNDVILPFMQLSAALEADGEAILETSLTETLDHEFGHHYGVAAPELADADTLVVRVDTPPQVSRHDGYETAFFDFEAVSFDLGS